MQSITHNTSPTRKRGLFGLSPSLALRAGVCAVVCLVLKLATTHAAEIQFRAECKVEGGLVLLGDVAEVHDADAKIVKTLSAIDLLPAPPTKEKRTLRVREIQDLLQLRGVNLNEHRFSGASQVTVLGITATPTTTMVKQASHLNVPMQQVSTNVRRVILDYLGQKTTVTEDWTIKFELKPDQAQQLGIAGTSLAVEGGESPWTGLQNLMLSYRTHEQTVRVPVVVQVIAPPTMVVATQVVARGAIVRASDVRLQVGKATEGSVYVFHALDEVVGKEAVKQLVAGQILDDSVVRRPILVQRSDIVTVYARTSGLRVRTTARAMEAGGEGDLVRVESLSDRKSFLARVTNPQEVEVFPHAPVAGDGTTSRADSGVQQAKYEARLPAPPTPVGAPRGAK